MALFRKREKILELQMDMIHEVGHFWKHFAWISTLLDNNLLANPILKKPYTYKKGSRHKKK